MEPQSNGGGEGFALLTLVFCPPFPVHGLRDLFWLPIEQYRKDGRIIRGLQRGAASFGTSTASAALELSNRLVQAIQVWMSARRGLVLVGTVFYESVGELSDLVMYARAQN